MAYSGSLVRMAREAAGLTQAQLAHRMGITQPAVARLERPTANPRMDTLSDALRATGHRLELAARRAPTEIDETQIAERLRLTPAQRLQAFHVSQRNLVGLTRRARRVR